MNKMYKGLKLNKRAFVVLFKGDQENYFFSFQFIFIVRLFNYLYIEYRKYTFPSTQLTEWITPLS